MTISVGETLGLASAGALIHATNGVVLLGLALFVLGAVHAVVLLIYEGVQALLAFLHRLP